MGFFKTEPEPIEWAWLFIDSAIKNELTPEEGALVMPLIAAGFRDRFPLEDLTKIKATDMTALIYIWDIAWADKPTPNQISECGKIARSPQVLDHFASLLRLLLEKNDGLFYLSRPQHVNGLLFNVHDPNEKIVLTKRQEILKRLLNDCIDQIFGVNGYAAPNVTKGLATTFGLFSFVFATAGALSTLEN